MSYSVMYAKKFSNRYIVPIHFTEKRKAEREAIIDTACSTTLVPLSIAKQFGTKHGNSATVIVGGGTYNSTLYTFENILLGNLTIEKMSAFAADYTGYLRNRVLLGMNVLINLNLKLKRSKDCVLHFTFEPWWVVATKKYPCGFFFADSGSRAVYPDLLTEQEIE